MLDELETKTVTETAAEVANPFDFISKEVAKFSSIGATYILERNGNVWQPQTGFSVGNGRSTIIVPIDKDLRDNLFRAFQKVIGILSLYIEQDAADFLQDDDDLTHSFPCYGLWLDNEASPPCFMFESGRVFSTIYNPDKALDRALTYAISKDQRYIYDLQNERSIQVVQSEVTAGFE
jgi:hypothetical protein